MQANIATVFGKKPPTQRCYVAERWAVLRVSLVQTGMKWVAVSQLSIFASYGLAIVLGCVGRWAATGAAAAC